uniref:Solute carrier family 25 member 3 n=1 Tax=Molossus molossus TaxID=27622 RepID=A0A7J8G1E6_MOLMO|nr:solute carrier family 25 member 3 [Molossus molossus]
MFSSVAHLARANPFNAPHLQLVYDGLAGPCSSPAGPPGPPRRSRNLAAAAVEEYSCEYGSMKFYALCGLGGILSCGLTHTAVVPLWMRQIPYTMMKFACFERTVEALYKFVVPKPRSECSKGEQLVVTFVAGYIAGVFCAIVSHPADSVVSVLNKEKGSTASQVLQRLGFKGVWKGLFARIIMIGTLTALQWFIYDSVKVYFRLPRPPPPEMPESLKKKLGLTQ